MEENLMQAVDVRESSGKLCISVKESIHTTKPIVIDIQLQKTPSKIIGSKACSINANVLSGNSFECRLSGASKLKFEKCDSSEFKVKVSEASSVSGCISVQEAEADACAASKICLNGSAQKVKADVSGASKINLSGSVQEVEADVSGASKINLNGTYPQLDLTLSGASKGNINECEDAKIDVSGASKLFITATKSLNGNVSGFSKVIYAGVDVNGLSVSGASSVEK